LPRGIPHTDGRHPFAFAQRSSHQLRPNLDDAGRGVGVRHHRGHNADIAVGSQIELPCRGAGRSVPPGDIRDEGHNPHQGPQQDPADGGPQNGASPKNEGGGRGHRVIQPNQRPARRAHEENPISEPGEPPHLSTGSIAVACRGDKAGGGRRFKPLPQPSTEAVQGPGLLRSQLGFRNGQPALKMPDGWIQGRGSPPGPSSSCDSDGALLG